MSSITPRQPQSWKSNPVVPAHHSASSQHSLPASGVTTSPPRRCPFQNAGLAAQAVINLHAGKIPVIDWPSPSRRTKMRQADCFCRATEAVLLSLRSPDGFMVIFSSHHVVHSLDCLGIDFPFSKRTVCALLFLFFCQLLNPKSVVNTIWVHAHSYTVRASFPNRGNWGRLTWEAYWDKKKRTSLLNVETLLKAE